VVDNFDLRIQPFLEENSKDIQVMEEKHKRDREHYGLRIEAWKRAWEDEAAIQEAARESNNSIYLLRVWHPEHMYHRVRLNMLAHYQQLISGVDKRKEKELGGDLDCA
jgi:hypothetical protein